MMGWTASWNLAATHLALGNTALDASRPLAEDRAMVLLDVDALFDALCGDVAFDLIAQHA
jgi:hypothetical protein